jgi:monoamine oxidase
MSAVPFDTLKLARALREKASLSAEQAEGITGALAEAFEDSVATRADIGELRSEIRLLEQRLTIKMGGMLAAAIAILLALEKLIK